MASSSVVSDVKEVNLSVNDSFQNHSSLVTSAKGSPPIKLKRTSSGCIKMSADVTAHKYSENSAMLSDAAYNSDNDLSGCPRAKRLYNLNKTLMPRSVALNVVLNGVRSPVNGSPTITSSDSSPVSINSHNIKTLISCIDNELELKKPEKFKGGTSNRDSFSQLYKEIGLIKYDPEELNRSELGKQDEYEMEPVFAGHQLVGDSQLLRFAQHIMGMQRKVDCKGKGWLGLCVGGQRICDLHRRVLEDFIPIAKKLIVLIGTNDLLKGTTGGDMCRGLQSLLTTLFKSAEKIIVLTLPPVPKIAYLSDHWLKLKKYNDFIFSLRDTYKGKLDVIDISMMFYQPKLKKCHLGFFELWFDGPVRRPDLIHINESGFKLMRDLLLKQIQ